MSELSIRAQGKWHHILTGLGVDANHLTNRHGPCPMCGGKDRWRWDDKDGKGTFYCNQCGSGDGVKLLEMYHGWTFSQVKKEVEAVLGVYATSDKPRAEPDKKDPRPLLKRLASGAVEVEAEDEVARYLIGRGLIVPPCGIKLNPNVAYYEDGKLIGRYPAMLAMVSSASGKPATYHITYLKDGKKAPVSKPKKLMPSVEPVQGGAVRLFKESGHLGIAEGIETAIAAHILFKIPVWSVLNSSGVISFVPPSCVSALTIFADNDENFAGQSAAYQAAHRLIKAGIKCDVKAPNKVDSDWNDWLLDNPDIVMWCLKMGASIEHAKIGDWEVGSAA